MIGRTFSSRYVILESIGIGGMAEVYRAQDLNTGKFVAVKVLKPEFQEDATFVKRFEHEALAASRMTHPNIVNLLDVGAESDGTRYLVIEFVSGKTLKQFIVEGGAMRPEIAAQVVLRMLAALQHAHQNGVIHRDIKPQNVLIDKEGNVKVADFGIARIANAQTVRQDTDAILGSVYYFSPEQAKGQVVDEKSDIYSIGVCLYELLCGQVPFTGDTPVAIAMKHLEEAPVPPSQINPNVPPALDYVCLKALEKRPRNRYRAASEMLRDLKMALEHPDTLLAAHNETIRLEKEARIKQKRDQFVKKRVRWMRRGLVGLFAIALTVVLVVTGIRTLNTIFSERKNSVEVPSVIGWTRAEALTLLSDMELNTMVRYDTYPLVPQDLVADQTLVPGTFVEPGTTITIVVCQSEYDMKMPTVVGMPLSPGQRLLLDSGLVIGTIEVVPSDASSQLIIEQVPESGLPIKRGQRVDLRVSGGLVVMPRLVGQTQQQAEQTLMAFGLPLVGILEEPVQNPAHIGMVLQQEPFTYEEILPGSSITITVGIPAASLYEANILVDTTLIPVGSTMTITRKDDTSGSGYGYMHTITDEDEGIISVPLYSNTLGTFTYIVYLDGVEVLSSQVSFTP